MRILQEGGMMRLLAQTVVAAALLALATNWCALFVLVWAHLLAGRII